MNGSYVVHSEGINLGASTRIGNCSCGIKGEFREILLSFRGGNKIVGVGMILNGHL